MRWGKERGGKESGEEGQKGIEGGRKRVCPRVDVVDVYYEYEYYIDMMYRCKYIPRAPCNQHNRDVIGRLDRGQSVTWCT